MDARCSRHQFEAAEGLCRHCGDWFCNECLVYSFGPNKPPFCISCALAASGVRSNAAKRPQISRRERKAREKASAEVMKANQSQRTEVTAVAIDWSTDDRGLAS